MYSPIFSESVQKYNLKSKQCYTTLLVVRKRCRAHANVVRRTHGARVFLGGRHDESFVGHVVVPFRSVGVGLSVTDGQVGVLVKSICNGCVSSAVSLRLLVSESNTQRLMYLCP